jgi:hypothetical protein
MRVSFIEDQDIIKKILMRLGLWEVKPRRPPPMAKTQRLCTEPGIGCSDSQVPPFRQWIYHLTSIQDSDTSVERISLPRLFCLKRGYDPLLIVTKRGLHKVSHMA